MCDAISRAKEVQAFVSNQLYAEVQSEFTDVEEWKDIQSHLVLALKELEALEGKSPEEEGELVLAILMGNCVAVRNAQSVSRALERAERVLPLLSDAVLKCKLACFCYLEFPDEELLQTASSLITDVKRMGRDEEIRHVEKMILDI